MSETTKPFYGISASAAKKYREGRTEYGDVELTVATTGRATCRRCGERIAKGASVIRTHHDFHGSGSFTATVIYIHADDCKKDEAQVERS